LPLTLSCSERELVFPKQELTAALIGEVGVAGTVGDAGPPDAEVVVEEENDDLPNLGDESEEGEDEDLLNKELNMDEGDAGIAC